MTTLTQKLKRLAAFEGVEMSYEHMEVPREAAQAENARLQPLIEALIAVAEAAEQSLWIDECRCDDAWTLRHKHAPDTYCGELNDVREALTALEKLSGDVK